MSIFSITSYTGYTGRPLTSRGKGGKGVIGVGRFHPSNPFRTPRQRPKPLRVQFYRPSTSSLSAQQYG